jgi:hypothetical protein
LSSGFRRFDPVIDAFVYCDASRVPESMFIDPINYRHFLLALRAHCNSHRTDIYIANSYLFVTTSMYRYVIGIADGDVRLFVNKVSREPVGGELVASFNRGERLINIYAMSDEEVWGILGFKYNAVGEEVLIDKPGVYRVQGDLLIVVDERRPFDLVSALSDAQERLLADVLLRLLTEMRVSVRVEISNNIIVPMKIPVKDPKMATKHMDTVISTVVEKVSTQLYERLRELGLAGKLEPILTWKTIIRAGGEYANCDIHVFDGGTTHGYDALPYARMNLVISPRCSPHIMEGTLLERMYSDFLQLYKPRNFELSLGNHHIKMDNVHSATVRYKPKWQPLLLGDLVVETNVSQGWYHVTPESVITITHDEHGIVTVKFVKEFSVRFRTLNLGEEHDQERNAIAFNLLVDFLS